MKSLMLATLVTLFPALALAEGTHEGGHDEYAMGAPATEGAADMESVEISMRETDEGTMIFEPSELSFAPGETVRLVITNNGELEHEFVMDTAKTNAEHKEVMAKFPEMEHDDPNAVRLQPGETGEILWTFGKSGEFEFACLIPGHYESGMHGPLNVTES
ncbi:MAG: cupredoxin family protein [Paracoccus sp. (in: a-proteobacteria)]|uniref:cupredoxin domain-containing protein n=1 Tax=Paracoccus TaxID=265 RepID=UPI0005A9CB01|nr:MULTISPECIES: cupredoxin family protein [Paracoccus]MBF5079999.1 cupredoxin family protein [Paracoccus sp. NBH48]